MQFEKFKNFMFGKLQKFPIQRIPKISNLINSKKLQSGKLQKFPIW